jgi:hypothetical protein
MSELKGVYEKLGYVQANLKAPKSRRNDFGKYNFRSAEDILEASKPICSYVRTVLTVGDELVVLGDRYYIKATARFTDIDTKETIENTAYAREEESKKGMDASQITGTASSYARKYALNGLFAIDDTKDADTNEYHEEIKAQTIYATPKQIKQLKELFTQDRIDAMLQYAKVSKLEELTLEQASTYIEKETAKREKVSS